MGNEKTEYVSVKIDAAIYRELRVVAAWSGRSVSEYLGELVRVGIEPKLREMAEAMTSRFQNDPATSAGPAGIPDPASREAGPPQVQPPGVRVRKKFRKLGPG